MKKKILFIDDNEMLSAFIRECFDNEKFEVITKSNGLDALAWLESGNLPDIIISDLNMPKLDGFEFIKAIKGSTFYKEIPLIVLSGNERSEDRIKCFKLGADDFIAKPFNPEELTLRINLRLEK